MDLGLDRGPVSMALREAVTETMTAFYGFPVGHWMHFRTTKVVENPFAVQLRTSTAKRSKMVDARALVAHASVHLAGRNPLRAGRLQPDGLLSHPSLG